MGDVRDHAGNPVLLDMARRIDPSTTLQSDLRLLQLERARRRRDDAAQGSPDWDAASEAVIELEAEDPTSRAEVRGPRLYLVRQPRAG